MNDFLTFLREYSPATGLIRLILAMLIGGIIGLERSKHGRAAGMRTHIIVCIGAALSTLIGAYAVTRGYSLDPTRLGAQVISGIGFLGTGIILVQNRSKIVGLTTAAGLWNTAIIGLSIGIGFYEGAIICFAIEIVTILLLPKLEYWFSKNDKHTMVYAEMNALKVNDFYAAVRATKLGEIQKIDIITPKSGNSERAGVYVTVALKDKSDTVRFENSLLEIEGVVFAVEM